MTSNDNDTAGITRRKEDTWRVSHDSYSASDVAGLAKGLRSVFHELGVSLHSSSFLGRCLMVVEEYSRSGGSAAQPQPDLAAALRIFDALRVCQRVTKSVLTFRNDPCLRNRLKYLAKDDLAPEARLRSRARNTAFELQVGHRLSLSGWRLRMAEPDFVCGPPDGDGPRILVACKQIERLRNLVVQLRRAKRQIAFHSAPTGGTPGGLVAIDLSVLFDLQTLKYRVQPDGRALLQSLSNSLISFFEEHQDAFKHAYHPTVLGFLLCATVVTFTMVGGAARPDTFTMTNLVTPTSGRFSTYLAALALPPN